MSENKKSRLSSLGLKAQLALLLICPIIMIAVCSVVIWFYASVAVDDESFTVLPEKILPKTTVSDNSESEITYFADVLENAFESGEVEISSNNFVGIKDASSSMSEELNSFLGYVLENYSAEMTDMLETTDFRYGEKAPVFSVDVLNLATDVVFETNEEQQIYKIQIVFENPGEDIANALLGDEDKAVLSAVEQELVSLCKVNSSNKTLKNITLYAEIDYTSDKLVSMQISRYYSVNSEVTFLSDLSSLGTAEVGFETEFTGNYDISYAGIEIEQNEIYLTSNGYDNLSIVAGVDKNATAEEFSLSFTSSDESIVTVDENGVVEAVKVSEKPATVTVTLNYLGNTYTDEVLVYVVVEAESVSLDKRSINLNVGDTDTLTATVKPKKATIKDVNWYSLDENVAKVNENGEVTAVGTGETKIIALSVNGEHTVACEVYVTQ